MSDPRHIEAEGDKPKVAPTRHYFSALRAGLKTAEEYSYGLQRERAALVEWLREQHAKAAKDAEGDWGWRRAQTLMAAYQRVLERLGEKPIKGG